MSLETIKNELSIEKKEYEMARIEYENIVKESIVNENNNKKLSSELDIVMIKLEAIKRKIVQMQNNGDSTKKLYEYGEIIIEQNKLEYEIIKIEIRIRKNTFLTKLTDNEIKKLEIKLEYYDTFL